jgi:hypothetical protein
MELSGGRFSASRPECSFQFGCGRDGILGHVASLAGEPRRRARRNILPGPEPEILVPVKSRTGENVDHHPTPPSGSLAAGGPAAGLPFGLTDAAAGRFGHTE